MFERRFVYSVEGLTPRSDLMLGGFGFATYLDVVFAKKAYDTLLPEGHHLNEIAEGVLLDCRLIRDRNTPFHKPYTFVENQDGELTSLLRGISVPGDACDLSIDGHSISNLMKGDWGDFEINGVQYVPHNVDNHLQAYALLSLFTNWANILNAVLD